MYEIKGIQQKTYMPSEKKSEPPRQNKASSKSSSQSVVKSSLGIGKSQLAQDTASSILDAFPDVNISFTWLKNDNQIRDFAMSAGNGTYLSIAPDFLEWMSESPETYQEGMDIITLVMNQLAENSSGKKNSASGAVIGENGEVSYWYKQEPDQSEEKNTLKSLLDTLESLRQKEKDMNSKKETDKFVIKKKICYSPSRDMSRLARVFTARDVRSIISRVYAQSINIKKNSSYDKEEVQMTVAQMEGVIARARAKIKGLNKEGQLNSMRKKAEKQQELKRAIALKLELKRRRTARRSREYGQISEKFPYLPSSLASRRSDGRLDPNESPLGSENQAITAAAVPLPPNIQISPPVPAGQPAAAGVAAANVVIASGAQSVNITV